MGRVHDAAAQPTARRQCPPQSGRCHLRPLPHHRSSGPSPQIHPAHRCPLATLERTGPAQKHRRRHHLWPCREAHRSVTDFDCPSSPLLIDFLRVSAHLKAYQSRFGPVPHHPAFLRLVWRTKRRAQTLRWLRHHWRVVWSDASRRCTTSIEETQAAEFGEVRLSRPRLPHALLMWTSAGGSFLRGLPGKRWANTRGPLVRTNGDY